MKYFKYFLFVLTALFSIQSYACQSGINKDLDVPSSIINSTQSYVCNNSCRYQLKACVDVDIEGPNGTCSAVSTGEACSGSNPDPVEEEEENPVLQCSTDSCSNPDNKRCPTGYTRGSFNGQNLCVKNNSDDDEECTDPNGCDESNDEIIAAIDRANNDITNSTNSLGQTLTDALNSVKNALGDIADKLQDLSDSIINGNNGSGENTNQSPDTSQFNADLPVEDVEINQNLDTGLYTSNTQCPAKKIINIPQYGLHFEFDFSEICNTLQMFGYLVLIFAYVVAARIVIKS